MKRFILPALLLLVLAAPARADIRVPPPPPPPPPPGGTTGAVVAGAATATGLALAGLWLVRARRRTALQG